MRVPSSRRVATTKPGTRRSCSAPMSRTALQTPSGLASSGISLRIEAMMSSFPSRSSWPAPGEPFLENLAVASGRSPEAARGHSGGAVEGADEVGEIGEPNVEGDVGDGARVVGEQAGRSPQTGAHQVLMRRDAEHGRERSQEVKGAEPGRSRRRPEVDGLVRMVVQPRGGLHRAATVAGAEADGGAVASGDDLDEAR